MAEFLRARESFSGACLEPGRGSVQVDVVAGRTYRDDHPAVAGRDHLFEPLTGDGSDPPPVPPSGPKMTRRSSKTE